MKHTNGPHDAPSERAHHPNGRDNAPSKRAHHPHGRNNAPSERTPHVPPSESAPSRRKLFQTGRSGALSERTGAIWDTDKAISLRDCTTCCEAAPSRAEIAPNGTKGCVSPNGAMHAMGRRDAPSEAKRHDAGRRGVSAVFAGGPAVLTGRVPCVNAAAKLGCNKTHTNKAPRPANKTARPPREPRQQTKPHAQQRKTTRRSQQAGPLC